MEYSSKKKVLITIIRDIQYKEICRLCCIHEGKQVESLILRSSDDDQRCPLYPIIFSLFQEKKIAYLRLESSSPL